MYYALELGLEGGMGGLERGGGWNKENDIAAKNESRMVNIQQGNSN